jgi:hypothetical protein
MVKRKKIQAITSVLPEIQTTELICRGWRAKKRLVKIDKGIFLKRRKIKRYKSMALIV